MKKATFDREMLEHALAKSVKIIPKKTIIPSHESVMIEVGDTTLGLGIAVFTTVNSSMELSVRCPVKHKENFAVCVPARILFKMISMFKENEIIFNVKSEKSIEIKCGKSRHALSMDCLPKDFPVMNYIAPENELSINEFYLKSAFNNASGFVLKSDDGAAVSTISITEENNLMVFQSTNKHIVFRNSIKPTSIINWSPICIMQETAATISSLLGDDAEIDVTHSGNRITFSNLTDGNEWFIAKATPSNATFPSTSVFFNEERDSQVLINTMELRSAVTRLELHSTETDFYHVKMIEQGKEIVLTCINNDFQTEGEESVTILKKEGFAPFTKGLNGNYILKCLKVIETNEFALSYTENNNIPCKIEPFESKDSNSQISIVVMGLKAD
jgi:DNA polymerase III sliding clamp (beta) subunit (PCNA family)